MSVNIEDLTLKQVHELRSLFGVASQVIDNSAWEVGKPYLIRTVTMCDTGVLVAITEHELVMEECSWVADTGRFSDALVKCEFGEVEPFPPGKVRKVDCIIDPPEEIKL